jgi:hypothetical protein
MLLSSFELLFEPITPKAKPPVNPSQDVPDPIIVQAYFVLISNVGTTPANLTLEFTSTPNMTLSLEETFTIYDLTNSNFKPEPLKLNAPNGSKGTAVLPPLSQDETALFLLQPDIATLLKKITDPSQASFGVRGYVNVSGNSGSTCLISPQTRGTFFILETASVEAGTPPMTLKVAAQEAYPLQSPHKSGNLFSF